MSETSKEIKGTFIYEQDSRNFHRFKFEAEQGIVGMIYVPKKAPAMPDRITLDREKE